ncbi:MAG: hypothetical protein R3F31_14245 [Verrucomicrobiales bacterium]
MKFRDYHSQATAELELAPMIDVVFLLLIFSSPPGRPRRMSAT